MSKFNNSALRLPMVLRMFERPCKTHQPYWNVIVALECLIEDIILKNTQIFFLKINPVLWSLRFKESIYAILTVKPKKPFSYLSFSILSLLSRWIIRRNPIRILFEFLVSKAAITQKKKITTEYV